MIVASGLTSKTKSSQAELARRFCTLKAGISLWLSVSRVMMGMKDLDATNPGKKASDQGTPRGTYSRGAYNK